MNPHDQIKRVLEMIDSLTTDEDVLLPKDEILTDEECTEDCDIVEDYDEPAFYGETRDEVISNLLSKYLGIDGDFSGTEVSVSIDKIKTALNDAFSAGADDNVKKGDEVLVGATEITESVDHITRESNHGTVSYDLDSETGVMSVSVTIDGVSGSLDIVSDVVYNKMQDILTNSSYTSETAIEKLNVMRAKISDVLQYFVDSESFKKHIDDQTSAVMRAYAVSLEELINKAISDEGI